MRFLIVVEANLTEAVEALKGGKTDIVIFKGEEGETHFLFTDDKLRFCTLVPAESIYHRVDGVQACTLTYANQETQIKQQIAEAQNAGCDPTQVTLAMCKQNGVVK